MLLRVTHIEDSLEARQRNALQFWAIDASQSPESEKIEKCLISLAAVLNGLHPPHDAELIDEVICAFDRAKSRWRRAKILDIHNDRGLVKTFFVDTGETCLLPLSFLRYLTYGSEIYQALLHDCDKIQAIKSTPALAHVFILADIAPPRTPYSTPVWTDLAMHFLKTQVEGKVWKAEIFTTTGAIRLYDFESKQPLAKIMVERGLAIQSQSYYEGIVARGTSPIPNLRTSISPTSPASAEFPILPTITTLPAVFRKPNLPFVSPEELVAASLAHQDLSYVRNEFPYNGRLVVKVVSAPQGPYGFTVHWVREEENLTRLQTQLQLNRFPAYEFIPKIGAPCILRSCDGLNYRGSVNSLRDTNQYLVELVDYGKSELCDFTQLHRITNELIDIPIFGYRVSLEDAEKMVQIKGLEQVFQGIVTHAKVLTAEAVRGVPNRVILFNHEGSSIRDILANILGSPKSNQRMESNFSSRTASPSPVQALPQHVLNIPDGLIGEELMTVTRSNEPGRFFGMLNKRCMNSLEKLSTEMFTLYEQERNPPLLYADAKTHIGQCGVIKLAKEEKYYRARVQKEMVNDVLVLLVDDGREIVVPRCDVFAPLPMLSTFGFPVFGIECRVDDVPLSASHWSDLIMKKEIHVRVEAQENGVYKVSFTNEPCNAEVKAAIAKKVQLSEGLVNQGQNTAAPELSTTALNLSDREQPAEVIPKAQDGELTPSPTLERPPSRGENRKNRNGSVREGYTSYQHPNSRNGASSSGTKADRDTNWRAGNVQTQEVIRNPRGPPPMDLNAKGPVGFQNNHQNSAPRPSGSPPQKEPSTPTVAPAKSPVLQDRAAYPAQVAPKGLKTVQIVFVEAIEKFYVQLSELFSDFANLGDKLNDHYSGPSAELLVNPTVGQPCVAKYLEDDNWYRGEIISVSGSDAEVFFVDYGNSQTTPLAEIKVASEKFLTIQPQAYLCRMAGLYPQRKFTDADKKVLEGFMLTDLSAKFITRDGNGKYPVRLFAKKDEKPLVVNSLFVTQPSEGVKQPKSLYHHALVPSTSSDLIMGKFYSVERFYLRNANASRFEEDEIAFEEFYSSLLEDELSISEPVVDLPCAVKSLDDQRFHRAQIKSIESDSVVTLFVDCGREMKTPFASLKRILPIFMKWSCLAWECKLGAVKAIPGLPADREKMIADCFVEGETVRARLKLTVVDGKFEAEVSHPKYGDISKYVLRDQLVELPPVPVAYASCIPPQDIESIATQVCYKNVMVYHAPSVFEFWSQLAADVVDEIMGEIQLHSAKPEFQKESTFQPELGKACLARYEVDSTWYRAVVTEVNGEQITVHYVDYGNSSTVSVAELRGLPPGLAKQPPQAVKCFLKGTEEVSKAIAQDFGNLLYNAVNLEVVERVGDSLCVRLTTLDGVDLSGLSNIQGDSEETPTQETAAQEPATAQLTFQASPPLLPAFDEPAPEPAPQDPPHLEQALPETAVLQPVENSPDLQSPEEPAGTLPETNDLSSPNESVSDPLENQELEACISYVVSPGNFWIQHSHGIPERKLEEMSDALLAHFSNDFSQYAVQDAPVIGRVYGVLHPDYNEWYRAQVTKVDGLHCDVLFLEYGDSLSVSANGVFELPEVLREVPALAAHCALELPEGFDGWSSKAVETLKKYESLSERVRVKLGKFENGAYNVESLLYAETNVIEEVRTALAEGMAEVIDVTTASTYYGYANELTPVTEYTEVESERHVTLDENATVAIVSNPEANDQDATLVEPSDSQLPPPAMEQEFADRLPTLTFTPDQKWSVRAKVLEARSVSEILLNLNGLSADDIVQMTESIPDIPALPPLEPQVGRACLSLYTDGFWYRAVVQSLNQDEATVLYVDFGNTATVKVDDLRRLPVPLAEKAGCGLKCALYGANQSSAAAPTSEDLQTLCNEESVTVVFAGSTTDRIFVRLLDKHGVDLNEKMGLSDSNEKPGLPDTCNPFINQSVMEAVFGDVTMMSLGINDTRLDADVSQMNRTVTEVLLEEPKAEVKEEPIGLGLSAATLDNEQAANLPQLPVSCNLDQESAELVVAAHSVNGAAQPTVVLHANDLQEAVPRDVVLSEHHLQEVQISNSNRMPTEETTESIATFQTEKQSDVDKVKDLTGNSLEEEIKLPSVNQETSEEAPEIFSEPIKTCLIGTELDAILNDEQPPEKFYISHVQSADHFWIQYENEGILCSELEERLPALNLQNSEEFALTGNPSIGELYAAYHSDFRGWFRARVVNVNKFEASVLFVDYGDSKTVQLENIRQLPETLRAIPPCAHECKWVSSAQDLEMWTEDAKEALNEISNLEYPFTAVFCSKNGILQVESLYINGCNVADLITRKLNGVSIRSIEKEIEQGDGSAQLVVLMYPVQEPCSGSDIGDVTPVSSVA